MAAKKKLARSVRTPRKPKAAPASIPGVKPGHVLVLRTCNEDMTAYGGFKWPTKGPVKCPDWDPTPNCGQGLHGALWGEGDGGLLNFDESAKWLVAEVKASDVVDLKGKVKFPRGRVVYCGTRLGATSYIYERRPGAVIIGGTATAGYSGTATAGDRGTATAGYSGTATAGYSGTATAGDRGTATAGYRGTATAGYRGTATAGDYGTATAGDGGTATAGYRGTATAGDGGTATAGYRGTATAGDGGTIVVRYYDSEADRYRLAVGYVGENGIRPNVKYKVGDEDFEEDETPDPETMS